METRTLQVNPEDTGTRLDAWLAGYPGGPVHHSDLFRHQYHPAYRVVLRSLAAAMSDQNS